MNYDAIQLAAEYWGQIVTLQAEVSRLTKERDGAIADVSKTARLLGLTEAKLDALVEYAKHDTECILGFCSQGRPTANGGYEQMFGGKWYQVKPVDETQKCTCGLDAALSAMGEGKGENHGK
jgi:hypothetical protein